MMDIEIPNGWHKLFFQMCDDIKSILEKEDSTYNFRFTQVKEKYNQLVCYFNDAPAAVKEIIMKYRRMAHFICTKCGKIAVYVTKGYIASFCNDCFKKLRHVEGEWIEYDPYYVMITINDGSRSEKVVSFEEELTRYRNTL